jgi:small subunit ribosomal protein S9
VAETQYYEGLGRRKTATARVRLYPGGDGTISVNNKPASEYFGREWDLKHLGEPLVLTNNAGRFNVTVRVQGGGITGQAGAIRLGIARALLKADPDYRATLRKFGLLTRDPRAKERKKPGLKRARKAPQYTKR